MGVVNQKETRADLGEVAEAEIHLAEPTTAHSVKHHDGRDHDHDHHGDQEHGFEIVEALRVAFVALAAIAVWFHLWEPLHQVSVIGLVATLIGGYPIFKEAFENILERRMTMELLHDHRPSLCACDRRVLHRTRHYRVRSGSRDTRRSDGGARTTCHSGHARLPSADGQRSQGRSDSRSGHEDNSARRGRRHSTGRENPVDGKVINGHSFVEQAAITGEPMPSEKSSGSDVYAGTINQAGTLQVRAERLGKETTFGKIIEAVENAERSRAPIQKTADRLAGYLVCFALGAAVLTFLITHNLRPTISVIIVAGACSIAAGTLAILGAIGRAARNGSIIKGGVYLEALGRLHTVFFDKTGTLTYGLPSVIGIYPAAGISTDQLIEAAASAERNSEHPWGRAVVRYAEQRKLQVSEPESFEYRIGRGVLAMMDGESVIVGKRGLLEELEIFLLKKTTRWAVQKFSSLVEGPI